MTGKFLIIFVLIPVIWRIINRLIEVAAKKKEVERQLELAQRGQDGREAVTAAPTTISVEQASTLTLGSTKPSRAQELAARRKAQLEELRKRRAQGTASAGRVQTKLGSTTGSGTSPVSASPRSRGKGITVTATDLDEWRREQAAMKRKAEQQKQREELLRARAEDEEIRRKAQQDLQRQLQQQEERKKTTTRRDSHEMAGIAARSAFSKATSGKIAHSDIRRRMMDRQTLRDLFIMKELIDPPVSMRTEES